MLQTLAKTVKFAWTCKICSGYTQKKGLILMCLYALCECLGAGNARVSHERFAHGPYLRNYLQ